jgi:hypothetical protein
MNALKSFRMPALSASPASYWKWRIDAIPREKTVYWNLQLGTTPLPLAPWLMTNRLESNVSF